MEEIKTMTIETQVNVYNLENHRCTDNAKGQPVPQPLPKPFRTRIVLKENFIGFFRQFVSIKFDGHFPIPAYSQSN